MDGLDRVTAGEQYTSFLLFKFRAVLLANHSTLIFIFDIPRFGGVTHDSRDRKSAMSSMSPL